MAKKKHKKSELTKLKEELIDLAKKITKRRDGNVCFSCGATDLEGKNWHGGHFIRDSRGGVELRYSLINIHSQCFYCNITLSGNEGEYYRAMVKKYGQRIVDKLFKIKHQESPKWGIRDYRDRVDSYRGKWERS